MFSFNERQIRLIKDWLPSLACGLVAWLVFLLMGETPLVRSSGLALAVVGVAATLRRLGAVLAFTGGLALSFSPAFWSQTGGGDAGPATIVLAVAAAIIITSLAVVLRGRADIALSLGLVIFVLIFWSQVGTPRSLRLTGLVTAWLFYILLDTLLRTNPRPDEQPPSQPEPRYTLGMLLLFTVGVINDPVLTLLGPAIVIGLLLSNIHLSRWYWGVLILVVGLGLRGIMVDFLNPDVPLLDLGLWRDAERWLTLFGMVIDQFSIAGVLLGVLGLARLSRWYPPLGTVTLVAYAAYFFFGLVYVGYGLETLLLPLLIIQVTWMTYAVFSFGQWLQKSFKSAGWIAYWFAPAAYTLLPLAMLAQLL